MRTIKIFAMAFLLSFSAFGQSRDSEREIARAKARTQIDNAWSTASTERLTLVLIEMKSAEYKSLFPRGLGHLPDQLRPRQIYPVTNELGAQQVQYLGVRRIKGFSFAVFRWITS
jgi:hypothetical protein